MQSVLKSSEVIAQAKPWMVLGQYSPSLVDALFPGITIIQKIAISSFFIGLLIIFGRVTFYLPDNPVPISFQTTGVLLMGGVLGLRWGLFAILIYYVLGMVGVPVFKDGGNGWHYVSSTATAGYLIGFLGAVPLIGFLSQHGWDRGRILWPMLLGNLFVYVPALLWLHFRELGWPPEGELFSAAMYPFIPGDLIKLMIASLIVGFGWTIVDRRSRSRRHHSESTKT